MDFTKHYQKAEDAYKKRNLDYAVEIYLNILEMDPNQVKARSALRAILIKKKEEGTYKGSGRLSGMSFSAKLKTLQIKKAFDQVITECDRYLTTDMDNVPVLKALGAGLMKAGHAEAAMSTFEAARMLAPKDIEIYKSLGELFRISGDLERSKKFWEAASQLAPQDAEVTRMVRDLNAQITSRVWESGDDYRSKIRDEKMAKTLEEQAHLVRTDDDIQKALLRIDELIADETDKRILGKLWRKKAEYLERRRDYVAAAQAYEKHVEYDPESYDAPDRIGDLKLKTVEERLNTLKEAVTADPSRQAELDEATRERDRLQIEEYRRRVRAHPTEMKHRFDLGRALLRAGEFDHAIENLQQSVNDGKLETNSLLLLAQAFKHKGLFEFAKGQCNRALASTEGRQNEVWKAATYTLGDVYEHAGELAGAIEQFQKIYLIDIGYRDVAERVEKLKKRLADEKKG